MTLIIDTKNAKQEKEVKSFLALHSIRFYTEKDEETSLLAAMEKGRKTDLLTKREKQLFIAKLKKVK
jgi:hypothetical protein